MMKACTRNRSAALILAFMGEAADRPVGMSGALLPSRHCQMIRTMLVDRRREPVIAFGTRIVPPSGRAHHAAMKAMIVDNTVADGAEPLDIQGQGIDAQPAARRPTPRRRCRRSWLRSIPLPEAEAAAQQVR